jgi:hypothetical protein
VSDEAGDRSGTDADEDSDGGSGCSSSDVQDDDKMFSSVRRESIYSGLFAAMERQALPSLCHLHVNESFLYLCGFYSNDDKKSEEKKSYFEVDHFLLLQNCESLEVLIIDLDLISHGRSSCTLSGGYVAVFTKLLQKFCLRRTVDGEDLILRRFKTVNFVVKTLDDFNRVFHSLGLALQGLACSSTTGAEGSGDSRRSNRSSSSSSSSISLKVSISDGLKSCRVGYLCR